MSPIGQMLNQLNYSNRNRAKDDAKKLVETYKSLLPKIGSFVNNAGVQSKLLTISGTIPIKYQGAVYNIPIELFVPERYPQEAPKVYVRPTSNMTIKTNHRHVDMQGVIYLPYLHEWNPHNPAASNLTGLVEVCSSVFSIEPPLFAKPTVAAPVSATPSSSAYAVNAYGFGNNNATPATATAASYSTPMAAVSATPTPTLNSYGTNNNNRNSIPVNGYAMSSSGNTMGAQPAVAAVSRPTFSAVATTASAANAFSGVSATSAANAANKRKDLLEKVNMKMQEKLYALHSQYNKEIAVEFENERYLEASKEDAEEHIELLKKMIEEMNEGLKEVEQQKAALEKWSEEESQKPKPAAEEYLQSYDDLSNQIVRLNAEVNAIDDALYFLERALVSSQNKSVDLNGFLREVRNLARQQFMCRAHLAKIQNACINGIQQGFQQQQMQQAPQPTMAASMGAVPPPSAISKPAPVPTMPQPIAAATPAPTPSYQTPVAAAVPIMGGGIAPVAAATPMMGGGTAPVSATPIMGGMAPAVAAAPTPYAAAYPSATPAAFPNAPTHIPTMMSYGASPAAVPSPALYQPTAYPAL